MFSGQVEFDRVGGGRRSAVAIACTINNYLRLRPLILSDANELFSLTETNRDYLRRWLPWLDDNPQREDTAQFIQRCLEREREQQEVVAAICYDGRIVGLVGLHEIDWQSQSAGVGYWLDEAQQGQGIMTAACKALIENGFVALGLNRIEIRCAVGNKRSEAIAKRLGFTYEGQLRDAEWLYDHFVDHKVYSVLRREWTFE